MDSVYTNASTEISPSQVLMARIEDLVARLETDKYNQYELWQLVEQYAKVRKLQSKSNRL